jgi:hypothetical protein
MTLCDTNEHPHIKRRLQPRQSPFHNALHTNLSTSVDIRPENDKGGAGIREQFHTLANSHVKRYKLWASPRTSREPFGSGNS